MDGVVNVKDATLIQKYIAGLTELTDEQKKLANVNNDDALNVSDATLIQKYCAGVISW